MARTLLVQVVSPEATLFEGEVEMVVASTTNGEIGVLAMHAPIVAELAPGALRLKKAVGGSAEDVTVFSVYAGYLQFAEDKMIVLADGAVNIGHVDLDDLKADIESLKQRLAALPESASDERGELERELAWAENTLAVSGKHRK